MNNAAKYLKYVLFLLWCIIIVTSCEQKALVTIQGERYTIDDFTDMHQFSPTDDSLQRRALIEEYVSQLTMIHEARDQGYEDDPVVKEAFETHRRDIISRGYYEKNVLDKVKVSEAELRERYARMVDMYHLAQIVCESESLARYIDAQLKKGASFDDLLVYSLDTLTENGDIGEFSAEQLPIEIFEPISDLREGQTTEPILFGDFYYILKLIEHSSADEPTFAEVKEYIKNDLSRQQAMEIADEFIQQILDDAKIEYNQEGLQALIKPESLLTMDDLNLWVIKKYDSTYVRVRTLRDAVYYQYTQSRIDPKRLIDRVLIPDLIYDQAIEKHYDESIKVKVQMGKALNMLMYQKYYSDNVLEKVSVDSTEVVRYYQENRDDYPEKSLEEAFTLIRSTLRENKIIALRSDLTYRLREQYQPVIHEDAVEKILKEE